jgi:hypothetical protein
MLKPQWGQFRRECQNLPGLNFLEIEDAERAQAQQNRFINQLIHDAHGYPTIRFYNSATKSVSQFNDDRTSEALHKFVKNHLPAKKVVAPKKKVTTGGAIKPKKVVSKPKKVVKKGGFVRDGVYFGDKSYSS